MNTLICRSFGGTRCAVTECTDKTWIQVIVPSLECHGQ